MTKNRLYRLLSRTVEIKRGEEVISLLLFFYFFLISAPYTIIKSVRNAKYIIEYRAVNLPVAYLLTAVFMGVVVAFHSKIQMRIPRGFLIISSLVFFILSSFIFGILFLTDIGWVPLVFFIWANVFIMVLMTQFWILVNDIFNPREAKRLIGFFVSGGILGGIAGGLFAGVLATRIPDYLLYFSAGMLVLNIGVVSAIFRWKKRASPSALREDTQNLRKTGSLKKVGFLDCFKTVLTTYYLKLLAAVVTITWIVSTFIDWQYNNVIENAVRQTFYISFFGYFNSALLVIPFFVQLLMTSNFIKRFGIRLTLLVYPLMLLFFSFGIAGSPSIPFALGIKGTDKSLSFSLNQSVRELLYIPISPEVKYKSKIFIDMFLNRLGKGIGALLLMGFILVPTAPAVAIRIVSVMSLLFILVWVALNLKVSKEYANIIKGKLKKSERADTLVDEKLDVDFMKLVLDTIEDKNRSSILYAMDIFDLIKQDKLTPEVKKLIGYKQDEVRMSSVGMLFEGSESGIVPEFEEQASEELLLKEIEEIMNLDVYKEVMGEYIDKILDEKDSDSETERMEIAKALGFSDSRSALIEKLEDLLKDESVDVRRYAISSAAKLLKREYVPVLIETLENPRTRVDARAALEKYGPKITGTLADYLGDPQINTELKKEVIAAMARIGNQEAADFLLWEMEDQKDILESELIDALDRIRSTRPDVYFKERSVKDKIAQHIKEYCSDLIETLEKRSPKNQDPRTRTDMPQHLINRLSNIFKLLGLIYPHEDTMKSYQNIRMGTKDSVAYAVELLDNLMQKEIKDALFPLIENLNPKERIARCRALLKDFPHF
jgi:HEAT repeat protein/MFS family permease